MPEAGGALVGRCQPTARSTNRLANAAPQVHIGTHNDDGYVEDLADFEQVLERIDPELVDWITGRETVPANLRTPVLDRILAFNPSE